MTYKPGMKVLYNRATFERYDIAVDKDGKIVVKNNGDVISKNNRKNTLLEIANSLKLVDMQKWGTDKLGLHLISFLNRDNTIKDIRTVMGELLSKIEYEANQKETFCYNQQRAMINQIFAGTRGHDYTKSSVMLRLVVIDSLYSTNAQYSYFSIEEMADKIIKLGTEDAAAEYFHGLVNGCEDRRSLFSTRYGIRKNLEIGSKQMSLMSKYAYYVLLQHPHKYPLGFPIYDSLAVEMYPKVCEILAVSKCSQIRQTQTKAPDDNSITIVEYIASLNELRRLLFATEDCALFKTIQQYDILDAYLWRLGKINRGNYSLLLNKRDYIRFIKNIGLDKINVSKEEKEQKDSPSFTDKVKDKTSKTQLDNIVKCLEDRKLMNVMIGHWLKYFMLS